jgi:hypothetical protein
MLASYFIFSFVLSDLVFNPSVFAYATEVLFVFKYDSIDFVPEPNLTSQ